MVRSDDPDRWAARTPRGGPKAQARRRAKKRGIVLATAGLGMALLVGLGLILFDLTRASWRHWLVVTALTLVTQCVLWFIVRAGWAERLTWDRHYLVVPSLAAVGLLATYVYFFPEVRAQLMMIWFAALLLSAGRLGFLQAFLLTTMMAAGYVAAVGLRLRQGLPVSARYEGLAVSIFLVIGLFAGVVFERLRRDRREMQTLRRELAELALTDQLTALPNRRQFEEILRAELSRSRRHGGPCSLAMIDVDHFKNFNDRLGHPAGDAVLRELGRLLRTHLRTGDFGARYGGEEFAVVMANTAAEGALLVLERLRRIVECHPFEGREVQPTSRLTISAGVAEFSGASGADPDPAALVKKADDALYAAKSAGRNRVCSAS